MQELTKRRPLTTICNIKPFSPSSLFKSSRNKRWVKGIKVGAYYTLSRFLTLAYYWHFDRVANFKPGLNCMVDGEPAALTQLLHSFLEHNQGYHNMLDILIKKSDVLSKNFIETNITQI